MVNNAITLERIRGVNLPVASHGAFGKGFRERVDHDVAEAFIALAQVFNADGDLGHSRKVEMC